jgi:O-antigen/teichoic acid export membrane protein
MSAAKVASGRILATNAVWTLAGSVVPAIVGLAAVPLIVNGFGVERFGILSLVWVLIGYAGIFDFGLGRAVTRHVSELLVSPDRGRVGRVLWTAWYLTVALGVVGAVLGLLASPWLVQRAVRVSPHLQAEAIRCFYLVALAVPVVALTAGVRGALEAVQRFGLVNAVRLPTGLLTFLVPLVTLQFTTDLSPAIAGLILVRLVALVAYAVMCFRVIDGVGRPAAFDGEVARDLASFGSWLTATNVVSPLMVSFDRFFVSALISVAAVAYYVTPYEAVSKTLLVPGAIGAVLFPAFAASVTADRQRLRLLFRAGIRAVFLAQLPLAFLVICFAPEILRVWLGPEFAARSTAVMRWLMLGVFVNGLAYMPNALLQGVGRSDLIAKLHLAELPAYVVVLVALIQWLGIEGAAIAWCLRVSVDAAVLFWLAGRVEGERLGDLLPHRAVPAGLLLLLGVGLVTPTLALRAVMAVAFFGAFGAAVWRWGPREERHVPRADWLQNQELRREPGGD